MSCTVAEASKTAASAMLRGAYVDLDYTTTWLQELPQDDLDYEGKATQRTEDERRTKGAAMAGRLLAMLDKK